LAVFRLVGFLIAAWPLVKWIRGRNEEKREAHARGVES